MFSYYLMSVMMYLIILLNNTGRKTKKVHHSDGKQSSNDSFVEHDSSSRSKNSRASGSLGSIIKDIGLERATSKVISKTKSKESVTKHKHEKLDSLGYEVSGFKVDFNQSAARSSSAQSSSAQSSSAQSSSACKSSAQTSSDSDKSRYKVKVDSSVSKKKIVVTNPKDCNYTVSIKKTSRKIHFMIGDRNVDDIVLTINPEVAYFSEMSVTIEKKQLDLMSQGTYCMELKLMNLVAMKIHKLCMLAHICFSLQKYWK